MCVVIAKPKGVQIRKKYLRSCYVSNPDGAGFMYVKDRTIVICKGYFSFETFWEDYSEAEIRNTKSPFVIHFRIATSGGVNHLNCHPFRIDEQNAFAHNGIFYNLPYTDKLSDTQVFNNQILKNLPSDWTKWPGIKELVKVFVEDTGSKVVFLDSNKEVWICGEDKGDWFKGAWYSNNSHTPVRSYGYNWKGNYNFTDDTSHYLVELDSNGTVCKGCQATVSLESIDTINGIGPLCLDCQGEYNHVLR